MVFYKIPFLFLIEIILEALPISSSGHLEIISYFFKIQEKLNFLELHFAHIFVFFTQGLFVIPFIYFLYKKNEFIKLYKLFIHIIFMNIITIIFYFLKSKFLKVDFPLFFGFFLTAIILYMIHYFQSNSFKSIHDLSLADSFLIGLGQSVSLFQGVSRLASVLFLSILNRFSIYDSFLIAFLTNIIFAGESVVYVLYYYFYIEKFEFMFLERDYFFLVFSVTLGLVFSYIVYYLLKKKKFWIFGLYEMILATIVFLYQFCFF